MKISEMNAHEKVAFQLVCNAMSEWIGGLENQMMDNFEDSEEYKEAKEILGRGHQALEDDIYSMVMADSDKGSLKHLRFAGENFIRERISRRLTKWGY